MWLAYAALVVAGARAFFDAHLAAPRLVDRWAATLGALGDRQEGGPPAFDAAAACTCEPRLAEAYARCAKCEITTKRGNTIAKFVGLVPKKRAA